MKQSPILFAHHIGNMFRKHWKIQGRKVVYDNAGTLQAMKEKGIQYETAVDFINESLETRRKPLKDITGLNILPMKEPSNDESHPDYKVEKCLSYGNHNVLLEGLKQAQALTNSVLLDPNTLPLATQILPEQELPVQDKLVRRCIRSSLLFDAWQEKLPKRHDPLREAWRFPRDYGITDRRRNLLLVKRLIQLCSSFNPQLLSQRAVLHARNFRLPYTLHTGERLLFSIRGDAVVFADSSPSVGTPTEDAASPLPDISPLQPTVSLEPSNIYKFEPQISYSEGSKLNKIHTVVIYYNETEVGNIFESPVVVDQILGRTLVHSWVFAMIQALKNDHKEPVTVQITQTDGKFFHFGVLKLCSQRLDSEAPRNMFWSFPLMNLFSTCAYVNGVPTLEDYNPQVFKTLLAFYNNV